MVKVESFVIGKQRALELDDVQHTVIEVDNFNEYAKEEINSVVNLGWKVVSLDLDDGTLIFNSGKCLFVRRVLTRERYCPETNTFEI